MAVKLGDVRVRRRRRSLSLLQISVLLFCSGDVGGHESLKYPPGVPPKKTIDDDIKFHDPYANQQPPSGQEQFANQQQPPSGQDPYANHHSGQQPAQPVPPVVVDHQQQQLPESPPGTFQAKTEHRHGFGGAKGSRVNIEQEKIHLKEHVEEFVDLDKMNEPQLMATYFRSFDLDKDGRIDGLELLKAILKMNKEHTEEASSVSEANIMDMVPEVDEELAFYDENNDGLITYPEFMRNHRKRFEDKP